MRTNTIFMSLNLFRFHAKPPLSNSLNIFQIKHFIPQIKQIINYMKETHKLHMNQQIKRLRKSVLIESMNKVVTEIFYGSYCISDE